MEQFEKAVKLFGRIILTDMRKAGINCWIAGGALRDYFRDARIKTDYDIFFPNATEYEKAKVYFIAKGAEVKFNSENGTKILHRGKIFDLVKHYFDSPQATIDRFDFTISMFAVDDKKVYYGKTAFIDLAKKQLIFNEITYPDSTLCRAFRHNKYGFTISLAEMKKLTDAVRTGENIGIAPSGYDWDEEKYEKFEDYAERANEEKEFIDFDELYDDYEG